MIVYLDMDGVMVDLHHAIDRDIVGIPSDWKNNDWRYQRGKYDIYDIEMLEKSEQWNSVDWWADLGLTPDCHEILYYASRIGDVKICTFAPNGYALEGKRRWVKKHIKYDVDIISMGEKHLLSDRQTVLIDDCDDNVYNFETRRAGVGLLVPRPWNSYHMFADVAVETMWDMAKKKVNY